MARAARPSNLQHQKRCPLEIIFDILTEIRGLVKESAWKAPKRQAPK